jgi:aminoacyl tRNA synthase complex-interacting multifunctional protein 1
LGRWFNLIQHFDVKKEKHILKLVVSDFTHKTIPDLIPKKTEVKKEEVKKVEKVEEPLISLADIRIGHILSVKKHEKADRLYVEQIDLGEDKPRTICSGLVPHMGPEELDQKKVLVFCNLKPKNAVGIDSFGMVLCATDSETKKVELVKVDQSLKPGTKVQWGDLISKPEVHVNEKKLKPLLEQLHTNGDGVVCFGDFVATVDGKKCTSNFKNAHVS